jgi:chromosomal replication initiator protein
MRARSKALHPRKTVDKLVSSPDKSLLWAEIAQTIQTQVSADTFSRWFKDIDLVELDDLQLTLRVPNNIYQFWIESNYLSLLESATVLAVGGPRQVRFTFGGKQANGEPVLEETIVQPSPPAAAEEAADDTEAPSASPSSRLAPDAGMNPRNTFASFVVGANNQFAHAACKQVSENPAKTYNPLFIYGGVGLGKTHLMQAIGHAITTRKKGGKVLYVTSERFTNEFIDAIQTGGLVKFRNRYRRADVLLIDDIQFLAGKERSQEEFFHTFNALIDGHKQVVLSSDRPPAEISNLEARLVSRFEWGLTAEMLPPDIETRVAILRKKAENMEVNIGDEALQFIAEHIRTNIRRLEGALTRVASFTSLNGQMPTVERLEHLLKDLLQEEARKVVSIDVIKQRVADHFDIRLADMTSKRRPANIAFPRQIAMYLSRELTKASLNEIGEAFGGRDHGTVLHAHRLVKDRMKTDEKTRQLVMSLDSMLQR